MSDQVENFNLLAAKLKLQTEQRIRYQQELANLSTKFDEFKHLQENIQLIVAHNHQAELDSWEEKYKILQEVYKLDKERNSSDDSSHLQQVQDENLQLKEVLSDTQHKLKTEKIRVQQNLELFLTTQSKLHGLQEQFSSQQLNEVNLAHLISLQHQVDQAVIEKLLKGTSSQPQPQDDASNELSQQYPTPVLLLEEVKLLKLQHKKDQEALCQLKLQVHEMVDSQSKINGAVTKTRCEKDLIQKTAQFDSERNRLEAELDHSNQLIQSAEAQRIEYQNEISALQNRIKEQGDGYQSLLKQYNTTQERFKQSHEDFANNLAKEMAELSLNNNSSHNSAMADEENEVVAELERKNKEYKQQFNQSQHDVEVLKNEITLLTQQNDELLAEINSSQETINTINVKHGELSQTLIEMNQHKQSLAQTANVQLRTVLNAVSLAREERDQYHQELVDKDSLLVKLQIRYQQELSEQRQAQIGQYISQLQDIQLQLGEFREELLEICDYITGLSGTSTSSSDGQEQNNILSIVKNYIKDQNETVALIKSKYENEVKLRKSIFNQLQELKGNIRVFARLRPISDKEKVSQGDAQPIQCISDGDLRVVQEKDGKKTVYPFEFEKVFSPASTQENVFEEVKDLIMSCMDGYNVCIFAYGQTGTGKTFTIEGPPGPLRGVNPRALEMLFNSTKQSSDEWDWTIKLTMVEIYNEKIQDLLRANDNGDINLKIVAGKDGKNEVQGCNVVNVTSAEEVLQYLAKGKKNRHMSATQMNAESSRSHLVVTVYTHGYNRFTKVTSTGRLNLIDLAGSERVSRSGVTGEGLKEAQNINASLSNLGSVIAARANKQAHVPYRNSQLTYLLQDSLDKNSKTLMIVQLSPTLDSVGETLCSLRFAARVKEVELGKATSSKAAAKE